MSADVAHWVDSLVQHGRPGLVLLPLRSRLAVGSAVRPLASSPTSSTRLQLGAFRSQLWVVVAVSVSTHAQQPRQLLEKEITNPRRHGVVGGWGAVVHVDDEDGDDDWERDKDHDEQQVLSNERDHLGGGRDDLFYDQEEHSEGHEDRGREWQLLSFVWGKVKHQDSQKGQTQARDDEEECVEQRQPLQNEGIRDEGVRVQAVLPVPSGTSGTKDLPLAVIEEVLPIYLVVYQNQVHHVAIVCPGAKLHGAVLAVEGEEGDVHGAGRFVTSRWRPGDGTIEPDNGFGHQGAFKPAISTE